ncbi:MAG: hypothetical protein AAF721_16155 [Myxococcota bacterium]
MQRPTRRAVYVGVGLLGFIVQGIGWRVGREIAEEGIDEVRARQDAENAEPPSAAEMRRQERRDARAAKKAERERIKAEAQRRADAKAASDALEQELAALKKKIARDRS